VGHLRPILAKPPPVVVAVMEATISEVPWFFISWAIALGLLEVIYRLSPKD
jgi:hypothetical protein